MYEDIKEYIKMPDLKNGYIYEIKARNANYGVWIENKSAFMISRWKFKANYLFLEIHWDKDEQFGTVKPIKLLEKFQFEIKDIEKYNVNETKGILAYLDNLDNNLKNLEHKSWDEIQNELRKRRAKK